MYIYSQESKRNKILTTYDALLIHCIQRPNAGKWQIKCKLKGSVRCFFTCIPLYSLSIDPSDEISLLNVRKLSGMRLSQKRLRYMYMYISGTWCL